MMATSLLQLLLVVVLSITTNAFTIAPTASRQLTSVNMAGFGGASRGKKKSETKKLKPRKQWDRYSSFKTSTDFVVSVSTDCKKWFPIGSIKTADNAFTDVAVIRQRALIAEHARRLFPTQILPTDSLEYGYNEEGNDLTVVGEVEMPSKDVDKLIGFKGLADESGFYAKQSGKTYGAGNDDGYGAMKKKGITGITALEVHD